MSAWQDLAQWLYGDVKKDEGFWYARPLFEVQGLTEEELFWVPDEYALCILWHVGHIAHREAYHMQQIILGREDGIVPRKYQVFGTEWCTVARLKESIDSTDDVFRWVESVRRNSKEIIASLGDEDFHRITSSTMELPIGHWVFLTVAHGALHIGKIQVLRNKLHGIPDNPC